MDLPSFKEDHISQIPALQMLMKLGYRYLTPDEALEARGNRSSNVLLETILKKQLAAINKIEYKGKEFPFSEANINTTILALRDLPLQDGFMAASQAFYDLVTLGKSLEQNVLGDKKSFSFKYIDWEHPENNVYHVTEEYSILRFERTDTYRPDIILFINGIPMVVIECKSPKIKHPIDQAIEQHLRNQQEDGIRSLYYYSNLVIGLVVNEARYATTATSKEFWSVWKEQFQHKEEEQDYLQSLQRLKNAPLPNNDRTVLFKERFQYVLQYFNQLEQEDLTITEQDKMLYNLCRPDRLLDIMYHFILFDDGVKKITRYQQYFAVKRTLERINKIQPDGKRLGGVIWHTQGSGKSLTMVMLAQLIAMEPNIKNPKIVLVTDRVDLDDQITETFKKCGKPVMNAATGEKLVELLETNNDAIITTIINKFQSAVSKAKDVFSSNNIFVLVDESHRTQYGTFNVKMQKVFPQACYIAFTGTPLLKKDKSTAAKFGGIIPGTVYTISNAVEDKAVVPLLYEGRHNIMQVNEKPLDTFFDRVSEPLTDYGKSALKRKFSSRNKIVQSSSFIENTAWDIVRHFTDNIQGTGFKGQLVTPNKLSAIRYRDAFKDIGKVSVELLISAPDDREGEEDAFEESDDKVKAFYNAMIDKYGNQEKYEKAIINSFKKQDEPEIIIVVDKLLTGFDAPRNQVLYLTRNLKEHTLLQAIARVNRLYPGKDYGYIIDYYGNLENLDDALHTYAGLEEYDAQELIGTLTNITKELEKLPQAHSELWDLFKEVKNKYDEPAYEELLSDEAKRHSFYDKLSVYVRILKLALASLEFNNNTPEKQVEKYKKDAEFFLALRVSVKRRYSDELDYKEYEAQVQKLIDKHITSDGDVLKLTELVNIFDKEERQAELEKLTGKAAKADHIASRTLKAISIKWYDDPVESKRLSELIKKTIEDYHQQRINEADYLARAMNLEDVFFNGRRNNVPAIIQNNSTAIAFYNLASEELKEELSSKTNWADIAVEIAVGIDSAVKSNVFDNGHPVIDWQKNDDIKGKIRIEIDDLLFELKTKYNLEISFDQVDQLIAECIKVAETKYKS
ncbi:MAG: type I restriction endonuclease subunit R [Flavobacterium lindanitolerans]|uniref:type I restriction endonuclease subunit R n=1 Tax=Flavobacterium lindanitolerans TaxID=428988 RepID=UPI001A535A32|nr:HsdR family type I site-specific deoxyribonuclease [Flavobacterium lindanitolerans]MBL7867164.1 type I restriction endonuclease subunit R [Flavobacterium lindanitolerans]